MACKNQRSRSMSLPHVDTAKGKPPSPLKHSESSVHVPGLLSDYLGVDACGPQPIAKPLDMPGHLALARPLLDPALEAVAAALASTTWDLALYQQTVNSHSLDQPHVFCELKRWSCIARTSLDRSLFSVSGAAPLPTETDALPSGPTPSAILTSPTPSNLLQPSNPCANTNVNATIPVT